MILKFGKSGGRKIKRRAPAVAVALAALVLIFAMPAGAEDDWFEKNPISSPSLRTESRMANIIDNKILLFDGYERVGDTWVYNAMANSWTEKTGSAEHPTARYRHAMAELPGDQVLLFGGWDTTYDGETWVYDLSDDQWTNKNPGTPTPSPRYSHAMAWINDDQVLLFGGNGSGGFNSETWVYDLSDNEWTQKTPVSGSPSARFMHAMEWLDDDRVLLFGGFDSSGNDGETWEYDLSENAWTQLNPSNSPPAMSAHSMALLEGILASNKLLLHGGVDTYVYDSSTNDWTELSPSTVPPEAIMDGMANAGESGVVLFVDSGSAMETWIFSDPPTLVELVSFAAESGPDGAALSWETASEIDCAGFRVWRCDSAGEDCEIVTDDLIDARGDEVTGASYSCEDPLAEPGTFYRYQLEDIEYSGKSTFHDTTASSVLLDAGWNLIDGSALSGQPVAEALASIEGQYGAVWTLAEDGWKMYDPAHPALSDLEAFEAGSGCWIYMYETGTLALQ